jgi:hypothetical protein
MEANRPARVLRTLSRRFSIKSELILIGHRDSLVGQDLRLHGIRLTEELNKATGLRARWDSLRGDADGQRQGFPHASQVHVLSQPGGRCTGGIVPIGFGKLTANFVRHETPPTVLDPGLEEV